MRRIVNVITALSMALSSAAVSAKPPAFQKTSAGFTLEHVGPDCPIIYDNDW